MVITEEFKTALIEEINQDADFGVMLFQAILVSAGDRIVTTTYLDRALARQSKEFDAKLARQSKEFDAKLAQIAQEFRDELAQQSKEFDAKLTRQTQELRVELDVRLGQQTTELKHYIDGKFGRIGSRWGEGVEANYRNFAERIVAQWGGTVTKWRRTIKTTDDQDRVYKHPYEVDIVVTNGKTLLVELKSSCDLDDVEQFLASVDAYIALEHPAQPVDKIILSFDLTAPAIAKAQEAGVTVILSE